MLCSCTLIDLPAEASASSLLRLTRYPHPSKCSGANPHVFCCVGRRRRPRTSHPERLFHCQLSVLQGMKPPNLPHRIRAVSLFVGVNHGAFCFFPWKHDAGILRGCQSGFPEFTVRRNGNVCRVPRTPFQQRL